MALEALICKECETRYPLEARYVCERCFGPLEVSYDFSDLDPERGAPQDPGRLARHLALCGLPALRRAPAAIRSSRG